MDELFDVDELNKSNNKKKLRNISIVVIVVIVLVINLGSLATRPHNSNADVKQLEQSTPISSSSGSTLGLSSDANQRASNSTNSTPYTSTPSGYDTNYTYTPPSTTNNSNVAPPSTKSNIATPDPTKCAGIRADMTAAISGLDAQAAQLRSQIQAEQSYITSNSSYDWHNGYGQAPPPDTTAQQAQLQHDQQQLNSVVSQINTINNSYITQLTGNMCP